MPEQNEHKTQAFFFRIFSGAGREVGQKTKTHLLFLTQKTALASTYSVYSSRRPRRYILWSLLFVSFPYKTRLQVNQSVRHVFNQCARYNTITGITAVFFSRLNNGEEFPALLQ